MSKPIEFEVDVRRIEYGFVRVMAHSSEEALNKVKKSQLNPEESEEFWTSIKLEALSASPIGCQNTLDNDLNQL